MTRARVLVVEDDRRKGIELQNYLISMGYEVVDISLSGSDAIQRVADLHPDLVLMDIQMKGTTNGVEAGDIILSRFEIPLIYVIAQPGQVTLQRAKATGPFGYIFEPLDDKHTLATIEIALLRNQLEKQLRESRQWLSTVLNSIGDGVIAVDEQGLITFINPIAEALTGWHQSDASGRPLQEVFSTMDEASRGLVEMAVIEESTHTENHAQHSIHALLASKNGKQIPVEITVSPIKKGADTVKGTVLVFRDVTERRQTMEEIKQHAGRAEALEKMAKQLNSHLELRDLLDMACNMANRALKTSATVVFLYDPKENAYKNMAQILEPGILSANSDPIRITFSRSTLQAFLPADNAAFTISNLRTRRDIPYRGPLRLYKIRSVAVAPLLRNDDVIGALICGSMREDRDFSPDELELLKSLGDHVSVAISNANMFERLRSGRERERKLAKSLVDVQETERRHIARELHDHLGQALTGLQFMLESTKNQTADPQKSNIEEIQKYTGDILDQVREMSLNLRPSMLDDLGLLPTVQWHIERYSNQTGIHVNFRTNECQGRFPTEIETTAYRILQEGLTNVARYAGVKEVFVRLEKQDETLWLEVLDKGIGFDPLTVVDRPTSGLGGMHERAGLVGGYLIVNSYPDQGTRILAALPLNEKPLERRKHDRNRRPG